MSAEEIKKRLHQLIDEIDDQAFLEALLTISNTQQSGYLNGLSDDEIKIIEEREAAYLRGEIQSTSWEILKKDIKGKHGF
jgi:hypothetical protein